LAVARDPRVRAADLQGNGSHACEPRSVRNEGAVPRDATERDRTPCEVGPSIGPRRIACVADAIGAGHAKLVTFRVLLAGVEDNGAVVEAVDKAITIVVRRLAPRWGRGFGGCGVATVRNAVSNRHSCEHVAVALYRRRRV